MNYFKRAGNIIRTSAGILTGKLVGLLRDLTIAIYFGANAYTDAFFVAFTLPNIFRGFIAEGSLTSVFMPFLGEKSAKSKEEANRYTSQIIIFQAIVTLIVVLLLVAFSGQLVAFMMPGYSENIEILTLAAQLLIVMAPYLIFISIASSLTSYLNVYNCYYVPYSSTFLLNISIVIATILGSINGLQIDYLAYGVLIGGVLQFGYIFGFAYYKGFRLQIMFKEADSALKETLKKMMPLLLIVTVEQIGQVFVRVIASTIGEGAVSYLFYAVRIFQFPFSLLTVALGIVVLVELSKSIANNDKALINEIFDRAIALILIITIPASAGLMLLSHQIVALIFGYINFTDYDIKQTGIALTGYSAGLVFISFAHLFSRFFYAKKQFLYPLVAATIGLIVTVAAVLMMVEKLGILGVTLGPAIGHLTNMCLLALMMRGYQYKIWDSIIMITKIAIAMVCMVYALTFMQSAGVHVLLNIIACILIYIAVISLLRVNLIKLANIG